MVQCGVPAVIKCIPAGIPQLSDPSPRYSRNIHTHTRGKPADSARLPPSPIPIPVHTSSTHPTCVGFARPITGKHVAIHKFGRVVPETRETDSQTDTLIAVLRSATRAD